MRLSISLLCATILQTFFQYGKCNVGSSAVSEECFPVPNMTCSWQDGNGNIYNLAPLIYSSTERIQRWLSLAGDCGGESETAICMWTPTNDKADHYKSIGIKMPKCTKVSNGIRLTYKAGYFEGRKSIVNAKCDRTKVGTKDATFKIIDENEWEFDLSHLCNCGNACLSWKSLTTASKDNSYMFVEIALPCGGILLVFGISVYLSWKRQKRRNNNNARDDERRPVLRQEGPLQEGANTIRNVPHESEFERRSAHIAPSRSKDYNLRKVSV